MIQRKQTIFLFLAFVLTLVCMCSRIGTLYSDGIEVARVFNLWLSDGPLAFRRTGSAQFCCLASHGLAASLVAIVAGYDIPLSKAHAASPFVPVGHVPFSGLVYRLCRVAFAGWGSALSGVGICIACS